MKCSQVFFQWSRQVLSGLWAFPLGEAPTGLGLSSQRVRLEFATSTGSYATMLGCSRALSLPHHDSETPVRFHSIPFHSMSRSFQSNFHSLRCVKQMNKTPFLSNVYDALLLTVFSKVNESVLCGLDFQLSSYGQNRSMLQRDHLIQFVILCLEGHLLSPMRMSKKVWVCLSMCLMLHVVPMIFYQLPSTPMKRCTRRSGHVLKTGVFTPDHVFTEVSSAQRSCWSRTHTCSSTRQSLWQHHRDHRARSH